MTTTVVFADATDGYLYSSSAVYVTARLGLGTLVAETADHPIVGQTAVFECIEGISEWNTSSIPDTDTVSAAVVATDIHNDSTTMDFTALGSVFAYGTLDTGDWQDGTELAALSEDVSLATSGITLDAYNSWTSAAGFAALINKTGQTQMIFWSSRQEAGTTPTGNEFFKWVQAENAGTTRDAKITVTHAAGGAVVVVDPFGMSGFWGA